MPPPPPPPPPPPQGGGGAGTARAARALPTPGATAGRGDDYREIFDQNLVLAALCGRAEAEAMSETGGVILFVSSGETTRPAPFTSIYAAAKAGLNHLVTSMAVELGPLGIRVLAMAPGTTRTEMVAAA